MSYYEPQGWQAPQRQASWEQPPPPSRSGMAEQVTLDFVQPLTTLGASSTSQREDTNAFVTQFEGTWKECNVKLSAKRY